VSIVLGSISAVLSGLRPPPSREETVRGWSAGSFSRTVAGNRAVARFFVQGGGHFCECQRHDSCFALKGPTGRCGVLDKEPLPVPFNPLLLASIAKCYKMLCNFPNFSHFLPLWESCFPPLVLPPSVHLLPLFPPDPAPPTLFPSTSQTLIYLGWGRGREGIGQGHLTDVLAVPMVCFLVFFAFDLSMLL